MDDLQYKYEMKTISLDEASFKPCYIWMTFNTFTKGIDGVFMLERSRFYMVAKIEHFSVFQGF